MSVSLGLVKMAARVWTESTATPVGVPRAMRAPTVNRVSIGPRQATLSPQSAGQTSAGQTSAGQNLFCRLQHFTLKENLLGGLRHFIDYEYLSVIKRSQSTPLTTTVYTSLQWRWKPL